MCLIITFSIKPVAVWWVSQLESFVILALQTLASHRSRSFLSIILVCFFCIRRKIKNVTSWEENADQPKSCLSINNSSPRSWRNQKKRSAETCFNHHWHLSKSCSPNSDEVTRERRRNATPAGTTCQPLVHTFVFTTPDLIDEWRLFHSPIDWQ